MPKRSVVASMLVLLSTWLVLLSAGMVLVRPVHAQSVQGVLVDEHTGEPVSQGTVKLLADGDSVDATLTDDRGFFRIEAPGSGTYSVVVEAFAYWSSLVGPFELEDDAARVVEARLSARPMAVEGLTVEAAERRLPGLEAIGFYDRMEHERGDFITPREIATSEAVYVQQLFYGRRTTEVVPVQAKAPITARQLARIRRAREGPVQRVADDGRSPRAEGQNDRGRADEDRARQIIEWLKRNRRSEPSATQFGPWGSMVAIRRTQGGVCAPWLYVDGIRVIPNPGETLADVVPMREVRAVEIYRAPFEGTLDFQDISRCECGALVFWTRISAR